MATPQYLGYAYSNNTKGDIEVIRDGQNRLRQIKTPQVLADIVVVNDYEFNIKYYDRDSWGFRQNGLWVPTGDPFVTWNIKNPNGASNYNTLRITKQAGGQCQFVREYVYAPSTDSWTLYLKDCSGSTLRSETRSSVAGTVDGYPSRTDTHYVYEDGSLVWQSEEVFVQYGWGYVPTSSTVGASGSTMSLSRSYYTNPAENGYKKVKSWTNYDGTWGIKDYDSQGRTTTMVRSYKDESMPATVDSSVARATLYDYTPVPNQGDDGSVKPDKPRTVTEKINNTAVAKTYYVYYLDNNGKIVQIEEQCASPTGSYGDTGNLRTIRLYDPAGANDTPPERLLSVVYPDGRMDEYTYKDGDYTPNQDRSQMGTFNTNCTGDCDHLRTTIVHGKQGTGGAVEPVDDKSIKEVVISDLAGNELERATYAYLSGSGYQLFEYTTVVRDAQGRRTDRYGSNHTHESWTWSDCCGMDSHIDATGIKTEYEYDAAGRLTSETKTGVAQLADGDGTYAAQADVDTAYYYEVSQDGYYQVRKVVTGSSLSLTSCTVYDKAGRVIREVGQDGLTTTYSYATVSGGNRRETKTLPSTQGSEITEITTYWKDGLVKSTTGTGVVHKYIDRGVTNGLRWNKVYTGPDLSSSPMWVQTTQDVFGRTYQETKPGYNSSTLTTTYHYNSAGQLERVESTGKPDTIYDYDDLGQVRLVCQDVNGNDTIDLASTDRITGMEIGYASAGGYIWRKTVNTVYGYDSQGSPSSTPKTVGERWEARNLSTANEVERVKEIDVHGNETLTTTIVDRDDADRLVKRTIDHPDSSTNELIIARNGLLQSHKTKSNLTTTYTYDALGRQTRITDDRDNYTDTAYYTTGTGAIGKVQYTQDRSGNQTSYTYDSTTGRLATITTGAGSAVAGTQRLTYTSRSELYRTWGNTPYPVEYGYDSYGRKTSMKTYRGGTGWDGQEWPTSPGDDDQTTWVYEEATGLLLEKQYDGHTQQDPRNIEYTYENDGRLEKRIWSRLNGQNRLETEYTYGASGNSPSDLTKIDYSDSTPDVEFTYNRLGKIATVTDAVGTRTLAYDPDELDLLSESIDGSSGGLYTKLITRTYDTTTGTVGRSTGFQVGTSGDPDQDYETTYAYDTSGRLEFVYGPGLDADDGVQYYRMDGYSDLVEYIAFTADTEVYSERHYQENRDLLEYVENFTDWSGTTVSKYDYQLDTLGRRTATVLTGTAFSSSHHWDFGYNDRSELVGGNRRTGTTPGQGTNFSPNGDFDFVYDPIGNRTESNVDGASPAMTYTTNSLNQYTATSNPTKSLTYDDDGNMTGDGTDTYTWDAENRLLRIEPVQPAVDDIKLEFKYDYMCRRVERKVSTYNGSSWDVEICQRFVWDGWTLVLVLDGLESNALVRKYTWGLDLSNSIQCAGGIGGLLACLEPQAQGDPKKYWFLYDGNGNVGQVIDATNPSSLKRVAAYEYDPYGNVIAVNNDTCDPDGTNCTSNTGYALSNPFRFSTKWFDNGRYYFGYRYYDPRLGRWISQDPIWELGWFESIAYHHLDTLLRSRLNADPGTVEMLTNLHKLLQEFKKPGPLEHKYGLSLYICADNNPISITDPLGGCSKPPPPPPTIPPGIPGPGGPAGTVGSAIECGPDLARNEICMRWRRMLIDQFNGDMDACDADPQCARLRAACETAGANP